MDEETEKVRITGAHRVYFLVITGFLIFLYSFWQKTAEIDRMLWVIKKESAK